MDKNTRFVGVFFMIVYVVLLTLFVFFGICTKDDHELIIGTLILSWVNALLFGVDHLFDAFIINKSSRE